MRITPVKRVVCRTESGDKLLQRAPIIIVSVIPIRHKRAVVVVAGALEDWNISAIALHIGHRTLHRIPHRVAVVGNISKSDGINGTLYAPGRGLYICHCLRYIALVVIHIGALRVSYCNKSKPLLRGCKGSKEEIRAIA